MTAGGDMERMSEEAFDNAMVRSAIDRMTDDIVRIRREALRARAEEDRLGKEVAEKDATIKALADALVGIRLPDRSVGCWCPPARDVELAGHHSPCERARMALRLAGRLP